MGVMKLTPVFHIKLACSESFGNTFYYVSAFTVSLKVFCV